MSEWKFDREAKLAEYMAIEVRPKAKAVTLAKPEPKRELPKPSLEVVVKVNEQSNRRALDRAKAEMEEARAREDRERFVEIAQIANHQAIEAAYAQRQWDAMGGCVRHEYNPFDGLRREENE